MNKTLSVNIGGMVFHIEEEAFHSMHKYLDAIKGYFTASDGRDEIIQDIEARIAEMFQERLGSTRQVVTLADVDHVKSTLGRPEQYVMDDVADEEFNQESAQRTKNSYRRLYRDPDDKVIGGVCAGISHYIGIDPLWLRLAFAVSFFIFGSGFLLYLLLIVIMPKAISPSEKLEMKGEKVSLSNLKKSYIDESGAAAKVESGISRFFDALGQIIVGVFRLIGKVIAVIFIVIGILILGSFALMLLAMLGVGGIAIPFFITDLFLSAGQQTMAIIGGFLLIGIPIIVILMKALQVLFKLKYSNKILNWSALALWIIGLVLSISVATSIAGEFKTREVQRIEIPLLQPQGDTLNLDVFYPNGMRDEAYYFDTKGLDSGWDINSGQDSINIGDVKLDIIKSTGTEFELVQIGSARGKDRRSAVNNARSIQYRIVQEGSTIRFDEGFILPAGAMYRGQKLQLVLKVPEGKTVYMADNMDDIIYDIENVTNTYDGDMVGKAWTMTPSGLECIGCNLPSYGHSSRSHDNVKIKIDGKGVRVKGFSSKDSLIKDGEDVNIDISEDGITIESN